MIQLVQIEKRHSQPLNLKALRDSKSMMMKDAPESDNAQSQENKLIKSNEQEIKESLSGNRDQEPQQTGNSAMAVEIQD